MCAPPHASSVTSPTTGVRGPAQLVSAAGIDDRAICERHLAAPPVARLRRAYGYEGNAHLEPFAAHIAIPLKPALHHVPPTVMARAGSEKLDAASPH